MQKTSPTKLLQPRDDMMDRVRAYRAVTQQTLQGIIQNFKR